MKLKLNSTRFEKTKFMMRFKNGGAPASGRDPRHWIRARKCLSYPRSLIEVRFAARTSALVRVVLTIVECHISLAAWQLFWRKVHVDLNYILKNETMS